MIIGVLDSQVWKNNHFFIKSPYDYLVTQNATLWLQLHFCLEWIQNKLVCET